MSWPSGSWTAGAGSRRHRNERVPILRHGDFTVYETSAIVGYIDDAFDGNKLTPADPQKRARMNQWISAVNGYYYPYLIYQR